MASAFLPSTSSSRQGRLYITFDDGPEETWTPRVLEGLRRIGAQATFFLIGERVQELPWIARLIADAGHEVALHCHRHIRHTDLDEAEIEADARLALATLGDLGLHPARWRVPWGICTPATIAVAERLELELVHWTLDTHDWRGDGAPEITVRLADDAALRHGGIVLMHDGIGPGALREDCANTVQLLGLLRDLAAAHGLELAALPPLFAAGESPRAQRASSSAGPSLAER